MTDYKFEGWMGLDAESAKGNMVWQVYEPKPWEETDVDIKITNSGICGSDLHALRSGWCPTPYPCVVGHEIVGVAVRVGSKAEGGIRVGDLVGVGAQSDSCLNRDGPCNECSHGSKNYCTKLVNTYAALHRNGGKAYGGYGLYHRCPSHFVIKIPAGLAPEYAAPLLCGGVTVYSALKHFGAGPGRIVAVAGVGGLGHFAVLFAKALGAEQVVGISRKASKRQEALDLGCSDYIATDNDADWGLHNARRFDLVISTVSSEMMPLNSYMSTLKLDGILVQVGIPEGPVPLEISSIIPGRRRIVGSGIGSPKEIQEMLQLAVDKKIRPWIEKRPMKDANEAILDMGAGKARFRYVLQN